MFRCISPVGHGLSRSDIIPICSSALLSFLASILYIFRRTLSMESLLLWMFSDCCYSYHRAVRDVNKAIKLPGVSGSVNVVKDLSRL